MDYNTENYFFLPKTLDGIIVLKHEAEDIYCVDNFGLKAHTRGLGYRKSKNIDDKVSGRRAQWGTKVRAVDEGDDWVRLLGDYCEDFHGALSDGSGSDLSDSEFGLSHKQLDDMWQEFGPEVATIKIALDDDGSPTDDGHCDSDFGISDEQLRLLTRLCTESSKSPPHTPQVMEVEFPAVVPHLLMASPAACPTHTLPERKGPSLEVTAVPEHCPAVVDSNIIDPLRHLMRQRKLTDETKVSLVVPTAPEKESANAQSPPLQSSEDVNDRCQEELRPSNEHLWLPAAALQMHSRASVVSHRRLHGTIWYLLKVCDQCEERFYLKRFIDFRRFHDALHNCGKYDSLPVFPADGGGLDEYVSALAASTDSFCNDRLLDRFFGKGAAGRVFNDVLNR
jgi:hypothetical protein